MNNKIYVYGDGEQKRSFSDISDCINALAHMVVSDRNLHREVYNIGPDKNEISIRELAESVSELTNKEPKLIYVPDRPREVKNAYCSSDKIKKEFNYNASVPLTDTLTSMIEWIQERKPQPFNYHLPIEITNRAHLPRTWTDKLF
jgi:UDP-glucose 4-epimerase